MITIDKNTVMLTTDSVFNNEKVLNSENYRKAIIRRIYSNLVALQAKYQGTQKPTVKIGLQFGINGLTIYHNENLNRSNPDRLPLLRHHRWIFTTINFDTHTDLASIANTMYYSMLLEERPFDISDCHIDT